MGDNNASSEDATITFHVKAATGPKYSFTLPLSTTTKDLKSKLAEPDSANVPAASQRLIYSGKVLKDDDTLAQYNVKDGNTMHLVRSAASNQRQSPANQSSTTSSSTSASQVPPGAGVPQNLSSGTGNDPLAGLTGARYAGFAGLPSLQELANPPSPEEMIRRLQDPNFAQQMNEALSNPQLIDMMIQQNPQLRAMGPQARQILQSEDFRRMMTNPDHIRSMMNMQNMMGGFGGMGGTGEQAFPMPGVTNTTDEQHHNQNPSQTAQNQQNPFGAMFGQGMPNPFMFPPPSSQPPATGTTRAATDTARDTQQQTQAQAQAQANPFAALFAPNLAAQGQPGQNPTNPNAANPFANNPFLANAYQNMMNNPEALQNAMQMLGMGGAGGAGAGAGANPFAMFGGEGAGFGGPPDNRPPEERYATQLRQLNEMGFFNFDQNIQALTRSGGDVNGALEWLFSQPSS